jgi:hypothetical protein
LAVEIITSFVGGGLVGYGTMAGICGGDICFGGALAGLGAEVVTMPLITYGVGSLMGGRGSLGSAYLGGLTGFGAGCAATAQDSTLGLALGVLLMPIVAPIFYEMNSSANATSALYAGPVMTVRPFAGPLLYRQASPGALIGVTGAM